MTTLCVRSIVPRALTLARSRVTGAEPSYSEREILVGGPINLWVLRAGSAALAALCVSEKNVMLPPAHPF